MAHGVHRERVAVHGPRTRPVGAGRLAHEGRWRVGHRVAAIVAHIGEGRAATHVHVVDVAHGRELLGVGRLGQRPGALVARVLVVLRVVAVLVM